MTTNKTKIQSFGMINKNNKPLIEITKKEKDRRHKLPIAEERLITFTDHMDFKRTILR
jgi:hypothetical protein